MSQDVSPYHIDKWEQPATLWIHPEGPVEGRLYLQRRSDRGERPQEPLELINTDVPFVPVYCEHAAEMRFYSKRAIVRIHHEPVIEEPESSLITVVPCELRMMDGSWLRGTIRELLRPEHRRLFDYLNQRGEPFLRLYLDEGEMCLVNKAYIVRATELATGT